MEALWNTFLAQYGRYLATLLAAIATDVILGVASALRRKDFKWSVLANFYRTNVIPKVLGWVAFSLMTQAATPELLGGAANYATPTMTFGAWGAVMLTLANSIYTNAKEVFSPIQVT